MNYFVSGVLIFLVSTNAYCENYKFHDRQEHFFNITMPYYAGTCVQKEKQIYLNEVPFLENKKVKFHKADSTYLISIIDGSVLFDQYSKAGEKLGQTKVDVRKLIVEKFPGLNDKKIEYQFLWLENMPAVYWKENNDKEQRQGVFNIKDNNLHWYCDGEGGNLSTVPEANDIH